MCRQVPCLLKVRARIHFLISIDNYHKKILLWFILFIFFRSNINSLGGKLSTHAAEFWFPESRNCTCCKGFKHGCECCKKPSVDTCLNPGKSLNTYYLEMFTWFITYTLLLICFVHSGCLEGHQSSTAATNIADINSAETGNATKEGSKAPSTVFKASAATTECVPVPADEKGRNICRFFQMGNCRFGASCRYSHDLGSAGVAGTWVSKKYTKRS